MIAKAGHGLPLDPKRLDRYPFTGKAAFRNREYAIKLYGNYQLDRPWPKTMSEWPKENSPERFDRHTFPSYIDRILNAQQRAQDVNMQINR